MKRFRIALLVGDIRDLYSNELTKGAMRAAKELACDLLIVPGRYYQARHKSLFGEFEYQFQTLFSYFKENNVDAVIACTSVVGIISGSDKRNSLEKFLERLGDIPVITVSGDSDKVPNICYDNGAGIVEGMEYLINKQHCRKIAMVAGPRQNFDSNERIAAYKETLAKHDLEFEDRLLIHCDFTERCLNDVVNLLRTVKGIDGIVFGNDRMAIGGYEAMRQVGLKVGSDIAIFGFDNIEKDIYLDPPLASVSADPGKLGFCAVEMAMEYCRKGSVENRVIPTSFINRDSAAKDGFLTNSIQNFEFKVDDKTDFDTFAKQTFLYIYSPSTNTDYKDTLYRRYLFFILEVEKLFRNDEIDQSCLSELALYFNKLFEADKKNELDIGRITIILEIIKEAILKNNVSEEKRSTIVYISSYVYRRLSSILSLRESNHNYLVKQLQHDINLSSSLMMGFQSASDDSFATMLSGFPIIGIKHSFLYLFKEPIENKYEDEFNPDEFMYLKVVQLNDDMILPKDRNQMIPLTDIFYKAFSYMKEPTNLVVLNLSVGEKIYGILLCEIPYEMFLYYESLIFQVSSAIRIHKLLADNEEQGKQLMDSLEVIKKNNIALDELAKCDELTKTLNRRGFLQKANEIVNSKENCSKYKYVVVGFADTDNLKLINDTHGHDEGDYAIISTAESIANILPENGVMGRIGGDEFALIFATDAEDSEEDLKNKLEEQVEKFNSNLSRSFTLSISLGVDVYPLGTDLDVKNLLDSADGKMYHIKKERHRIE